MKDLAYDVIPYLLAIIGFLVVWILTSIRDQLAALKTSVDSVNESLREELAGHDRRITVLEVRNGIEVKS